MNFLWDFFEREIDEFLNLNLIWLNNVQNWKYNENAVSKHEETFCYYTFKISPVNNFHNAYYFHFSNISNLFYRVMKSLHGIAKGRLMKVRLLTNKPFFNPHKMCIIILTKQFEICFDRLVF